MFGRADGELCKKVIALPPEVVVRKKRKRLPDEPRFGFEAVKLVSDTGDGRFGEDDGQQVDEISLVVIFSMACGLLWH